jgi:hypothetical protein
MMTKTDRPIFPTTNRSTDLGALVAVSEYLRTETEKLGLRMAAEMAEMLSNELRITAMRSAPR